MTEERTPAERLLDLFVYAPAGLALTVADELPHLAEKGRRRVEGQLTTARLVGQFAVQLGRREVGKILGGLASRPAPAPPAAAGAPTPAASPEPAAAPSSNGHRPTADLAIPGYDALSASQVVERLGGLAPAELEQVRRYEQGHRHRRTILSRVDQLLAAAQSR